MDMTSSKWPCLGQSLTMRIWPSRSMIWALISPTFSLSRTSWGSLPSRICWRISGTHLGQRESVVRGQPRGGFSFCHDFSSGLSDHFGVNDGFGRMLFSFSKTDQVAWAVRVTARSAYLTAFDIWQNSPVAGCLARGCLEWA